MWQGRKISSDLNQGSVRVYDGQYVIVMRTHDHETIWVRYEDDRTNVEYLVPTAKLR